MASTVIIRPTRGPKLFTPLEFTTTEPTTPTTPTRPEEQGEVTTARLDWGLKQSFRTYVKGPIAHGGWTPDGVTGEFQWETLTAGDYETGTGGQLTFGGGVRFTAARPCNPFIAAARSGGSPRTG